MNSVCYYLAALRDPLAKPLSLKNGGVVTPVVAVTSTIMFPAIQVSGESTVTYINSQFDWVPSPSQEAFEAVLTSASRLATLNTQDYQKLADDLHVTVIDDLDTHPKPILV